MFQIFAFALAEDSAFRFANEIAYTQRMKWTLLVPGALVPDALAPDLARAEPAPRLSQLLAQVQGATQHHAAEADIGAAHWSWLARTFGLNSDPPVSAPYAWQALGGTQDDVQQYWIAFCDPVHMAVGRDSVIVTDLADAPLLPEETEGLLSLARDALCEKSEGATPDARTGTFRGVRFRLEVRNEQWFLLADTPIDLQGTTLDSVLGKPAHERMPSGSNARAWRNLTNQIQMLWHTSAINAAREQRGASIANGLWVHGGGQWKPLPPNSITQVRAKDRCIDAAVLRGWLMAGSGVASEDVTRREKERGDTLSLCRVLFRAFAFQDWESWLLRLSLLEEQLAQDLAAARACGAKRFDLVVCGLREIHTLTIPLHVPWWRRVRIASRWTAPALQRWFAEAQAFGEQAHQR